MSEPKKPNVIPEAVLTPISTLKPHPRNYRVHTEKQLEHIKHSLIEHGLYRNVVAARDFTILAGHGLVQAAGALGFLSVPVIKLDIAPDDIRALKVLAGDNEIANMAQVDEVALARILWDIQSDVSGLLGTGFRQSEVERMMADIEHNDQHYSKKIESPVYVPKGDKPLVNALFNMEKTDKLIKDIRASKATPEEKIFLIAAAQRHTVFDFEQIANYYAQSNKEVQRLMEASALVIIDFDAAIANGYVKLAEEIIKAYLGDKEQSP